MNEVERRELAKAHRDEIEVGYAVPVTPKRLGQIMSVRLSGEVAGQLRDYANAKSESVSDVIRRAVLELLETPGIGFRCAHAAIVSNPGVLLSASADCGCVMRKVFDPSEVQLPSLPAFSFSSGA